MVERAPARRARGPASIVKRLAGKRVFLTGVTGFLGQAVFERFLLDFPDTRLVLLVRPQLGSTGRQRLLSVLSRSTFDPVRDREGPAGIERLVDERVEVVEGDF